MDDLIEIDNATYYNDPKWWPFMPEDIFNALELSELKGAISGERIKTKVSKKAFNKMLNDFNQSMK